MQWKSAALASAFLAQDVLGQAMMRFQCSQVVRERIDPLVQPGVLGSAHMHQIVGGNSINATMTPITYDPSTTATCTTCDYSQDFSNYWTANMYFKARNGTYKRVKQIVNEGLSGKEGMTVYYIPPYDGHTQVTAFPKGFRMLAGDASLRTSTGMQRGICHRCWTNKQMNPFGGAPCTGSDTAAFPSGQCAIIRATVTFPTCWDGKNIDSPSHKEHIAYPATGTFESGGACPSTHPVKLPQVMYEVMYDTSEFSDKSLWPADGSQPFVYSMGDTTGYGQHGDYLFGWQDGMLQKALNARCNLNNCQTLKTQSSNTAVNCQKNQEVIENDGSDEWLTELPGGNVAGM